MKNQSKIFKDIDANTEHMTGDCSVSIVFKHNDKIHVANTGDIRSIISAFSKNQNKIVFE